MAGPSVFYHDEELSKEVNSPTHYSSDFGNVSNVSNSGSSSERETRELKVDKRILQIMQRGGNQEVPSSEAFFTPLIQRGVEIDLSSSFRDRQGNEIPIVKVSSPNSIELERACATIMEFLDPHRDKMTFNIDVPSSDHSFIIGKDGVRIKQLSRDTNCHIHLPDCNKAVGKKSNKISIAGTSFANIELARDSIRKNLPLNIQFCLQVDSNKISLLDSSSSEIQSIKRRHIVDVNFYGLPGFSGPGSQSGSITVSVKGNRSQLNTIFEAIRDIFKLAYGVEYFPDSLEFEISIDISYIHHQYVRGKNNCNLKVIHQRCGASIIFPQDKSNIVRIQSRDINRVVMGWQEIMGYLPLMLSFDLNLEESLIKQYAAILERKHSISIRYREKLASTIYTLFIKTQERHSLCLNEIREQFLAIKKNVATGMQVQLSNSFFQEPLALASTSQALPSINGTINTFTFPVGQSSLARAQCHNSVSSSAAASSTSGQSHVTITPGRAFGTNITNFDRSHYTDSSRHQSSSRSINNLASTTTTTTSPPNNNNNNNNNNNSSSSSSNSNNDCENHNPFQRPARFSGPPGFGPQVRTPTTPNSLKFRPAAEAVTSSPITDSFSDISFNSQILSQSPWLQSNKDKDCSHHQMSDYVPYFGSDYGSMCLTPNTSSSTLPDSFSKRNRMNSATSKTSPPARRLFPLSPTIQKPAHFVADYLNNLESDECRMKSAWKASSPLGKITENFSEFNLPGSPYSTGSPSSTTPTMTSTTHSGEGNFFKTFFSMNTTGDNCSSFSSLNGKHSNHSTDSGKSSSSILAMNLLDSVSGNSFDNLCQDFGSSNLRSMSKNLSEPPSFSPLDGSIFGNSAFSPDIDCSSRSSSRDTANSASNQLNQIFPYMRFDQSSHSNTQSIFP